MKLYHGTVGVRSLISEFPKAKVSGNGMGFYLTTDKKLALMFGPLITYEVNSDWKCNVVRKVVVEGYESIEYVLSQREADELVIDHAVSINY